MNLTNLLSKTIKRLRSPRPADFDHKQEALIKQGREQFKKLLDKGLGVPVVFL
jgi:hypothetical protein